MIKINYFIIALLVFAVAAVGGWFTSQGLGEWYDSLIKPAWTPDGGMIGLVWTIIFILTAISAVIVYNWSINDWRWSLAIKLFVLNGLLNIFWSYLWFVQHALGWALIEMIILEVTVVAIMILIFPRSKLATLLLLPYAGWVAFATYLAFSIWQLN